MSVAARRAAGPIRQKLLFELARNRWSSTDDQDQREQV